MANGTANRQTNGKISFFSCIFAENSNIEVVENNKKLFIETYGCQMNVADSEVIGSILKIAGYNVRRD